MIISGKFVTTKEEESKWEYIQDQSVEYELAVEFDLSFKQSPNCEYRYDVLGEEVYECDPDGTKCCVECLRWNGYDVLIELSKLEEEE